MPRKNTRGSARRRARPAAYRPARAPQYRAPRMRRVNNLIYDAAEMSLGVGVLGAVVNTSTSMWNK